MPFDPKINALDNMNASKHIVAPTSIVDHLSAHSLPM